MPFRMAFPLHPPGTARSLRPRWESQLDAEALIPDRRVRECLQKRFAVQRRPRRKFSSLQGVLAATSWHCLAPLSPLKIFIELLSKAL